MPDKVRGAGRARADADRRAALRGLFSHRLGPGAVRPRAGHSVPGARLGGQLGGLLLPGRHVGRSRADGRAVRAVRQPRAERGPRHRRRFRARAPRRGAAVCLRQIRPRAGRHDRRGDHLSPPLGGPRRGQGAGLVARSGRRPGQERSTHHRDDDSLAERCREAGIDPAVARRAAAGRRWSASWSAFRGIFRSTSAAW